MWGQEKKMKIFDGNSSSVLSICFSPDGNTLAWGNRDNSIYIKDVKTGRQLF